MNKTYLQFCVAVTCVLLGLSGYTVVARRLPVTSLDGSNDVSSQLQKRSSGFRNNKVKENEYLEKLETLDPVDLCFVGCRICFQKDDILLSCVNDLCLQQVIMGQSPANSLWSSMCPALDF